MFPVEGGGGGGRSKGKSKGLMGKGRSHHGARGQADVGGDSNTIINMDPEIRTNLLFPGKQQGGLNDDETLMGGFGGAGHSGSPSLLKTVFGAGWGRRPPGAVPPGLQNPADPRYQLTSELACKFDPVKIKDWLEEPVFFSSPSSF